MNVGLFREVEEGDQNQGKAKGFLTASRRWVGGMGEKTSVSWDRDRKTFFASQWDHLSTVSLYILGDMCLALFPHGSRKKEKLIAYLIFTIPDTLFLCSVKSKFFYWGKAWVQHSAKSKALKKRVSRGEGELIHSSSKKNLTVCNRWTTCYFLHVERLRSVQK